MPPYSTIHYERQENIVLLTLNRPERRNALDLELTGELRAGLQQAAEDDQVRAVLLTGAGKGFCAGADLSMFQSKPTAEQVYEIIISSYKPLIERIAGMNKPVIAAINGVAAGAGASLALACDLRLMAHDASIMMAFSNIGLVPDAGATWFLARQVGYSRAFEIAAEGNRIPAERCLELGLTNKIVPAEQLLSIAIAWARKLAERPTLALGLTKQAMQHAQLNDLSSTMAYEATLQKQAVGSQDFMEGVLAFMQKREPNFKGK
jgi:2-(1,2-epoxy-1,2-dihydrophenyl)acetyl-CoA isomerase